jgi:PAS domain-containing protein
MLDVDPRELQPERMEHTEAQLRQQRKELRRIVDLIPQAIIVLNPNGKAIYANRVALEYTGLSLDTERSYVGSRLGPTSKIEGGNSKRSEMRLTRSKSPRPNYGR